MDPSAEQEGNVKLDLVTLPAGSLTGRTLRRTVCSAHYSAKGRSTFLEDAAVCEERLCVPRVHLNGATAYCIFDGHGGDTCAKFAAQRYKDVLLQELLEAGPGNWPSAQCFILRSIDEDYLAAHAGNYTAGSTAIEHVSMSNLSSTFHQLCTACDVKLRTTAAFYTPEHVLQPHVAKLIRRCNCSMLSIQRHYANSADLASLLLRRPLQTVHSKSR
jgi:hypothetical protein